MTEDMLNPGKGKRLLLVDDDDLTRSIVIEICARLGFTDIIEAKDGGEALGHLQDEAGFALILSDWHMEPVGGLELLREVRSNERLNACKFVMMTARNEMSFVIDAKRAGVDGYILKPFGPTAFAEKLALVFNPKLGRR